MEIIVGPKTGIEMWLAKGTLGKKCICTFLASYSPGLERQVLSPLGSSMPPRSPRLEGEVTTVSVPLRDYAY